MAKVSELKDQAHKLEQEGQLERALTIYQHILKHLEGTPAIKKELPLYVKVGDLHLKLDNASAAEEEYRKAAKHYAEYGSAKSLVALSVKILQADPLETTVHLEFARDLIGHGKLNAARLLLLDYAQRAKLERTVQMLERIEDSADEEVEPLLEKVIESRERIARQAKEELAQTGAIEAVPQPPPAPPKSEPEAPPAPEPPVASEPPAPEESEPTVTDRPPEVPPAAERPSVPPPEPPAPADEPKAKSEPEVEEAASAAPPESPTEEPALAGEPDKIEILGEFGAEEASEEPEGVPDKPEPRRSVDLMWVEEEAPPAPEGEEGGGGAVEEPVEAPAGLPLIDYEDPSKDKDEEGTAPPRSALPKEEAEPVEAVGEPEAPEFAPPEEEVEEAQPIAASEEPEVSEPGPAGVSVEGGEVAEADAEEEEATGESEEDVQWLDVAEGSAAEAPAPEPEDAVPAGVGAEPERTSAIGEGFTPVTSEKKKTRSGVWIWPVAGLGVVVAGAGLWFSGVLGGGNGGGEDGGSQDQLSTVPPVAVADTTSRDSLVSDSLPADSLAADTVGADTAAVAGDTTPALESPVVTAADTAALAPDTVGGPPPPDTTAPADTVPSAPRDTTPSPPPVDLPSDVAAPADSPSTADEAAASGRAEVVVVEGLQVESVTDVQVGGSTGYRVVHRLGSGETLELTSVPGGAGTAGSVTAIQVSAAGDSASGSATLGEWSVSARGVLSATDLETLLGRLVVRPRP